MTSDWPQLPIGSVAEGIYDGPHATPKKIDDGPIFLGISSLVGGRLDLSQSARLSEQDFVKWTRRVTPTAGDLVFSYETRLGEAALIPDGLRCCLGRRMGLIRPDPSKLDSRYLLYAYLGPQFQETLRQHTVHGSTVDRILLTELPDFPLAVPPLDEQRRIAGVLGALDDKIELNRRMNRTVEEMAQAIFKSWFIDFDGVPESEKVDSELGPIPKGWDIVSLREHIALDKGLSYKGKFLTEDGVPMVNLKCVRPHGGFRRGATKPYSGDYKPRHVVRPGDLVIANTDLTQARDILGCPAFVPAIAGAREMITTHHTFAVRFHDGAAVERNFLYHLLLSPAARRRCRGFATGTTVLAVPRDAILDFRFALPPAATLAKFEEAARLLRGRIEANEDENDVLARTRDALLPKLVSGEVRVPPEDEEVDA